MPPPQPACLQWVAQAPVADACMHACNDPLKAALSLTPAYLRGKGNAYDYQVISHPPSACLQAVPQGSSHQCMHASMHVQCPLIDWQKAKDNGDAMRSEPCRPGCRTGRSRWGGASAR